MNPSRPFVVDDDETRTLRALLVAQLVESGAVPDPLWRRAFRTVPRHALVPTFFRAEDYELVSSDDRRTWLEMVYSDETLITQKSNTSVTSSGTMPSLVSLMLHALDVQDDHYVLQIGSGTGYTAALLCERLGSDHVTTIDIDPDIAQSVQRRLAGLEYYPTVATGDGAAGHAPNAPYDRFLATCALPSIPRAWLTQSAPQARIVAPIAKGIISLEVHDSRNAQGGFLPEGGFFMPLRRTVADSSTVKGRRSASSNEVVARSTPLTPRDTYYDQHVRFFLTLTLPELVVGQHGPALDDLLIRDGAGSSARLSAASHSGYQVAESGPRSLWTEVENLHEAWQGLGRPRRERFGITVASDRQWFWLDDPHGEQVWPLAEQ